MMPNNNKVVLDKVREDPLTKVQIIFSNSIFIQ